MSHTTPAPTGTGERSRTWSCILFDLDGTITDSAPGITATLVDTFVELGRPVPTPVELLAYVGPPLLDAFRALGGMSVEEAQDALVVYRRRYNAGGLFDSSVYPGLPEVLARIAEAGVPLSLATSKPESAATRILEHYGLAHYFTVICGASEDEVRSAKADVVEEALRRLRELGVDLSTPVMVGDREHDVHGAAAHGVPTIMVEWGYGSPLEAVGTIALVSGAAELADLLLP
ncbi:MULTISPECIES: HAD hydrolase-like protein [unclassified Rathayibacter]|uniref:HAD hydrolase-like protein n=1 Tax=unclassified Rathayibacter TaxID=2609250 RepID=UPI00188D6717|nr:MULTISPECIES: HAD hydrolase-like protein [unclassified Rathayibacter]MBF4461036.1 HAD hydrolase-like protein [Rathayibacter sp. VKM Ac-2879]MBF4502447.1 HAD hydrolase-like protein [Rathayibacter sp. VKM Ac-2878]